jgi:hypothetical protein
MSELYKVKDLLNHPEQKVIDLYKILLGLDELFEGSLHLGDDDGQTDEFLDALEQELTKRYPGHGKQMRTVIESIMAESDKA